MKKLVLFLALISVVMFGYGSATLFAQSDEDDIRRVIENYFRGVANSDLDLIMQQFSSNFSGVDKEGNPRDYNGLKSSLAEGIKNIVNVSVSDSKISNINIQDTNATAEEEHNFKWLRLDTVQEVSARMKIVFSLVKEGDSWKIAAFMPIAYEKTAIHGI